MPMHTRPNVPTTMMNRIGLPVIAVNTLEIQPNMEVRMVLMSLRMLANVTSAIT